VNDPYDIYISLQKEFRKLNNNYGKIPQHEFMHRSVQIVALMDYAEKLIQISKKLIK